MWPGISTAQRTSSFRPTICCDRLSRPRRPASTAQFSWAADDEAALEGARVWKGAQPDESCTEDWRDPRAMYERAAAQVGDDDLKEKLIVSSDPAEHVERIREVEQLGATAVCLMNVSGADPHPAIATYREHVLPRL